MGVSVLCDSCEYEFKVSNAHRGKRIRCPSCGDPVVVGTTIDSPGSRRQSSSRESFHLKTIRSQRQSFYARVSLAAGFLTGLAIVAVTAAVILKPASPAKEPPVAPPAPGESETVETPETRRQDDGFEAGPFSESQEAAGDSTGISATAGSDDKEAVAVNLQGVIRDETATARGKEILGSLDRIVVETKVNPQDVRSSFRKLINGLAEDQVDAARLRRVEQGTAVLTIQMLIEEADNRSVFRIDANVSVTDAETGAIDKVWERREDVGRVSKLMLNRGTVPPEMEESVKGFFQVFRKDIASAGRVE